MLWRSDATWVNGAFRTPLFVRLVAKSAVRIPYDQRSTGISNLVSKLGQIGPKWDKYCLSSQNVLKLFKSPRFVPFGTNPT